MDIVIRSIVVFTFIFALTRIVGKRELGSMEPFDLILLIVIGDLAQQGVTQSDYSVTGTVLALSSFAVMTVAVSYVSYRFRVLRPLLDGRPIVLISDGEPIEQNLRRERIAVEELAAAARLQQVARFADVRIAILETNGQISFIMK